MWYENIMCAELNAKATTVTAVGLTARAGSWKTRKEACMGMPELREPRPG